MALSDLKKCLKCDEEKSVVMFSKNKNTKDGLQIHCKACVKEYAKVNRNSISEYQKQYREAHKEENKIYSSKYRKENEKELSSKKSVYRAENKEKIAFSKLEYEKDRMITDPSFKLRKRVSLLVRVALNGNKSHFSILDFLEYTIDELKIYLESKFEPWMTWDNWGKYDPKTWNDNDPATWKWQIDHIVPRVKLPYTSMKDENFRKCWALSNLRPLSAKTNIEMGSKTRRDK